VLSFLDPWADPQRAGYQLIQSRVGLASGGIFGVGLGASKAKWGFLPFAHTDFIFAIVGEELGLVGASVVVGGFIAFGIFGIQTAARAESRFGASVAVGVTAWIVIQAFVNIGAVVGILPITGVPLPFLSYGGTSMVVTLAAVGLLLNVARHPAPVTAPSASEGRARRSMGGSRSPRGARTARNRARR
jgi:cell division protein FtsW